MSMMSERQVLRTKPIPNELLGVLIERFNLLPSWYDLPFVAYSMPQETHPGLYENLKKLTEDAERLGVEVGARQPERDLGNIEGRVEKLKQYILGNLELKPNLQMQQKDSDFIWDKYLSLLSEALERHENFIYLRQRLREAAELTLEEMLEGAKLPIVALDARTHLVVDEGGKLRLVIDELTQALDGVEIDRVRECKLCKRIFWAGRKDKKCCSDRCNNVYNVRSTPKRKVDMVERYETELRRERFKESQRRRLSNKIR
jgi:hypothetical protein